MQGHKQHDVLLTYGWCRSSYAVLRSLSKKGLVVAVADEFRHGMSQWSKYAASKHIYRSPHLDPVGFVDDISAIVERTGARVIIPGHEELLVLARYRDHLPSSVKLPVTDAETLEFVNDKLSITNHARLCGVSVAAEVQWTTLDELSSVTDPAKQYAARARRGNGAKGVAYSRGGLHLGESVQRLSDRFSIPHDRRPVVQEYVEGDGWGVSCLYQSGQRIASFTHRRLREKTLSGGTSTLRIAQHNPLIEDYAHTILDSLNWHGVAMVEFKYNSETSEGWFIEINPRLWGSIDLPIAAGVDFPWLLYSCALGTVDHSTTTNETWKSGVSSCWLMGHFLRQIELLKAGHLGIFLREVLAFGATSYDDVKLDDIGAFFGELLHYASRFVSDPSTNPIGHSQVH